VLGQVLPLALLDTISVSTLVIPLWFLLSQGRLRFGNVFRYLLLVAAGYLVLGIALLGGISARREELSTALDSRPGDFALMAVGIGLILLGAWYGLRRKRDSGQDRLSRWRDAVVGESASVRGVVTVAAIAIGLEIAMMFPYLVAIDTLADSDSSWVIEVLVLALYCLVMVAPAMLLTVGRMLFGAALMPVLGRVNDWIRRNEQEDTAWLLAIVGFLILSSTTLFE
jgi:LPXTG-motif cell wall-anchored protein